MSHQPSQLDDWIPMEQPKPTSKTSSGTTTGELDNCHKPPGAGKPCRVLRVCITMGLTIMSVFALVVIILALLTLKGYLSPSQVVV